MIDYFNTMHYNKGMKNHKCTCGKNLKIVNVFFIGVSLGAAWYNCRFCGSTFMIKMKNERIDLSKNVVPFNVMHKRKAMSMGYKRSDISTISKSV